MTHSHLLREALYIRGAGRLACIDLATLADALIVLECERVNARNRALAKAARMAG